MLLAWIHIYGHLGACKAPALTAPRCSATCGGEASWWGKWNGPTEPPSVDRAMAGSRNRPNIRVASCMNTISSVATTAANKPRGTPASKPPVFELVLRHLGGVQEDGAGDGEVDPE